jgi:hypothetical protein
MSATTENGYIDYLSYHRLADAYMISTLMQTNRAKYCKPKGVFFLYCYKRKPFIHLSLLLSQYSKHLPILKYSSGTKFVLKIDFFVTVFMNF